MQAMAAYCEAAWHSFFSGDVGWVDGRRRHAQEAENAREAMSHAIETGEQVAAVQIGVMRNNPLDNPGLQSLELAEQCTSQLDATVPLVHHVRTRIRVAELLVAYRRRRAMEAAQTALGLVQGSPELRRDRFLYYLTCCRVAIVAPRGSGGDREVQRALAQARVLEDPDWPPHRRFWRAWAELFAAIGWSPDALRLCHEALALALASGGSGYPIRSNLIDAELAAGNAQAVRTGEALLADLQGGREEFTLARTRVSLTAAWLALDDAVAARRLAQASWAQGRLFGLQHLWADSLSLIAALEARPRAAARLAGYADAACSAHEWTRDHNEATDHTRACTLARAALGDSEFDRLKAEGHLLRDEQIEAIAFATEDTS